MGSHEVIGSYHALWTIEQSFRMSKTDLRARPMFVRTRDAIEAHLKVVFTALAMARHLQQRSGVRIKKIVQSLRPLQEITIGITGQHLVAQPQIPTDAQQIIDKGTH